MVCLFQWSIKTPANGERITIGRDQVIANSLNAVMRPENITPMRAMITMWVRRSPNCETVLDRLKKVIPRFFRRLNTAEFIHFRREVNDGHTNPYPITIF